MYQWPNYDCIGVIPNIQTKQKLPTSILNKKTILQSNTIFDKIQMELYRYNTNRTYNLQY